MMNKLKEGTTLNLQLWLKKQALLTRFIKTGASALLTVSLISSLASSQSHAFQNIREQLAQAKTRKQNKLRAVFRAETGQGLDEFARPYSSTSINLSRKLNRDIDMIAYSSYLHIFNRHNDPNFPNSRFGDTSFGVSYSPSWRTKNRQTVRSPYRFNAVLTLPTSIISKKSGQRFSSSLTVLRSFLLAKRLFLSTSLSGKYFNHEFSTNAFTGTANPNFALAPAINLNYQLTRKLSFGGSASHYTYWDYEQRQKSIQGYALFTNLTLSRKLGVYAQYSTRNRTISNESFFDDDNTYYTLGVTYAF